MMRLFSLISVFAVVVSGGSVRAQYDFYEFMNPAGQTPAAQTAPLYSAGTLHAPRLAQSGEDSESSGDKLRSGSDDVTLGGPEVMEMPPLTGQSVLDLPPSVDSPSPPAQEPQASVPDQSGSQPPAFGQQPLGLSPEPYAPGPEPHAPGPEPHAPGPDPYALGQEASALAQEPYALGSMHAQPHSHHYGVTTDPLAPTGCGNAQVGCGQCAGGAHGFGAPMPYRQPLLPPPASLYGYFNSPPAYAHLWDTYPQEAALHAAHRYQATQPYHGRRSIRGELVEPCR